MRKLINILAILICIFLSSGKSDSAILGKPLSLQELLDKSSLVIVGTIIKIQSSWNLERTRIFTSIEIEIEESIKGEGGRMLTLTIRIPGGTAEGITERHSGIPTFCEGERVILFLDPGRPYSDLVGGYQGKYTIRDDKIVERGISIHEFIDQIRLLIGP